MGKPSATQADISLITKGAHAFVSATFVSATFVSVLGLALFAAAVVYPAQEVSASNCALDEYNHNGSLMELQVCDGGGTTIVYTRPRSSIARQGVGNGTLLFDGYWNGNRLSGTARLFSARCGEITYNVSGRERGGTITLTGRAPRRNNNCVVTGYRNDRLVFVLQGAPPVAGPGPDPGPGTGPGTGRSCGWYAIFSCHGSLGVANNAHRKLGGGNLFVVNTNNYPGFANGWFCVVSGPVNKGYAASLADSYRSLAPTAYIRNSC